MSTYITQGVVLKAKGFKQHDRLYTIFTARRGKVEAVGTSSRKILSKLSPHLVPFAELEVVIAPGKRYDKVAGAQVKNLFLKPPYHLQTAVLGTGILEITDALTTVSEPDIKTFESLCLFLGQLNDLPKETENWRLKARSLLGRYIYKLLKNTGLAIQVTRCSGCQGELVEPVVFSFAEHGFFHKKCHSQETNIFSLSADSIGYLQALAGKQDLSDKDLPSELLAFLVDYVQGQAGRAIYTLKLLRSIL